MPADDDTGDEAPADAASSLADTAAALQLDLDDDEFADLALGDDDGSYSAPASEHAEDTEDPDDSDELDELDELDVMELDPAHVEEQQALLYLEVDGRWTPVEKERFVIGRVSTMCDLAIRDVNVSRQHCAIERRGNDYFAVDLGSINGILIDGKKADNHRIVEGDVLVLSGHEVVASFHAPPEPEADLEEEDEPYPLTTGEFPPVPEAEPEHDPELEPDPEPLPRIEPEPLPARAPSVHVHNPAPAPAPVIQHVPQAMPVPLSFEERVEQRLDYMAQQLAYLQQSLNAIYARIEQLQGIVSLADMIQGRLAAKRRDR